MWRYSKRTDTTRQGKTLWFVRSRCPNYSESTCSSTGNSIAKWIFILEEKAWRSYSTYHPRGIGFVPYSPLGKGFLTGTMNSNTKLADNDFSKISPRFTPKAMNANLAVVWPVKWGCQTKECNKLFSQHCSSFFWREPKSKPGFGWFALQDCKRKECNFYSSINIRHKYDWKDDGWYNKNGRWQYETVGILFMKIGRSNYIIVIMDASLPWLVEIRDSILCHCKQLLSESAAWHFYRESLI